jgi:hypothetical protein
VSMRAQNALSSFTHARTHVPTTHAHRDRYELQPDVSLTGGAWYTGTDFDAEYITIMSQLVQKIVERKDQTAREKFPDKYVLIMHAAATVRLFFSLHFYILVCTHEARTHAHSYALLTPRPPHTRPMHTCY